MMFRLLAVDCIALALGASFSVSQTPLKRLANSMNLTDGPHYINDHTVVLDAATNTSHIIGIFKEGVQQTDANNEIYFVHAVADGIDPAGWDADSFVIPEPADPKRYALQADSSAGETHIWAPHVMRDEKRQRWIMVYQSGLAPDFGNEFKQSIKLATSDDLYTWERLNGTGLAFEDICDTRDPRLLPGENDEWHVFYSRCDSWSGQKSGVAYRTSKDGLQTWSDAKMALTLDLELQPEYAPSTYAAHSESPFPFYDDAAGDWFLSLCSPTKDYLKTLIFRSKDGTPFNFDASVAHADFALLHAHAAEWVLVDGKRYVTSAGGGQGGVFMSQVDLKLKDELLV